jgi:hypothetical protein
LHASSDLTDSLCSEPILEHIYSARPPLAKALLSQYLAHPAPRPALLYLPEASPPTTVYSVAHAPLLRLCPSRSDAQPLAVLEFLHRVTDVFEDFLGAPLLSGKIESNYDVVAQLLGEMCDGGIICNTEANPLRENIEVSGGIGKLLTQVGLPGYVHLKTGKTTLAHDGMRIGHHQLWDHRIVSHLLSKQTQTLTVVQPYRGEDQMCAILRTSSTWTYWRASQSS